MKDPIISELQDKVIFDPNPPPLPDRFTHHHGGTVTVILKNGQKFTSTCRAPRGSGPRGIDWTDVNCKYEELTRLAGMQQSQILESLQIIHRLESEKSINRLVEQLKFCST